MLRTGDSIYVWWVGQAVFLRRLIPTKCGVGSKLVQRVASPDKDEAMSAHQAKLQRCDISWCGQEWWALRVVHMNLLLRQLSLRCDFCCAEFGGTLGSDTHILAFRSVEHWLCRYGELDAESMIVVFTISVQE